MSEEQIEIPTPFEELEVPKVVQESIDGMMVMLSKYSVLASRYTEHPVSDFDEAFSVILDELTTAKLNVKEWRKLCEANTGLLRESTEKHEKFSREIGDALGVAFGGTPFQASAYATFIVDSMEGYQPIRQPDVKIPQGEPVLAKPSVDVSDMDALRRRIEELELINKLLVANALEK